LTTWRGKRFFPTPEYPDLLRSHKITDSTDTRNLFQKAKQPGREANSSRPSSAEVKYELSKLSTLLICSQGTIVPQNFSSLHVCWRCSHLVWH